MSWLIPTTRSVHREGFQRSPGNAIRRGKWGHTGSSPLGCDRKAARLGLILSEKGEGGARDYQVFKTKKSSGTRFARLTAG